MQRSLTVLIALGIGCGDNRAAPSDGTGASDAASADSTADASSIDALGVADLDAPVDAAPVAPSDPAEGSTSGTRLKLVWYVTQDGIKGVIGGGFGPGFHDSLRDDDCYPQRMSDGNTHCSPVAMEGVYTDASCTALVGLTYSSTCANVPAAPAYISQILQDCSPTATTVTHVYHRGAPTTVTKMYRRYATGCTLGYIDPESTFYAVGAEVAPSERVQMTPSAPEGTGTLQTRWWTTADGLRSVYRAYDSALADDCIPTNLYSGAPSCIPYSGRSLFFADSTCSERELGVASACTPPTYSYAVTDQQCPKPTFTFYTTGAAASSTPLFWLDGSNTCRAQAANSNDTYYAVGAEVTPQSVQHVTDTMPSRRLQLSHYTATEFSFRDRYYYDTMYGGTCQLTHWVDGTVRCVPLTAGTIGLWQRNTGVVSAYSDAQCTTPVTLLQVYNGDATCAPIAPPAFAAQYDSSGTCTTAHVHLTGAPYTGMVYEQTNNGCFGGWSDERFAFYDASTVVPDSSIASATRYVEP